MQDIVWESQAFCERGHLCCALKGEKERSYFSGFLHPAVSGLGRSVPRPLSEALCLPAAAHFVPI